MNAQKIAQHISFFLCGAFSSKDILAASFKPLFHLEWIGESFGIRRRGQWLYRLSGFAMFSLASRILGMASGAAPFIALTGSEKNSAPVCVEALELRVFLSALGGVKREKILGFIGEPRGRAKDHPPCHSDYRPAEFTCMGLGVRHQRFHYGVWLNEGIME